MNVRATGFLFLALQLAGCASDPAAQQRQATQQMEHKIQVYSPACEKLGYEKNSDAWRECIQREYEQVLLRMQQWNHPLWSPYVTPFYRPCYPVKGGWRCQ